jgi:hypothetical protein
MNWRLKRTANKALAALLACALCSPLPAQQQSEFTLRVESELVLVNGTGQERKSCGRAEAGKFRDSGGQQAAESRFV